MTQKELKDMTVAEAKASGQTDAYNKLVAGYSTPNNAISSSDLQTTTPTNLPPAPVYDNSNVQSGINNFSATNQTNSEIEALKAKSQKDAEGVSQLYKDIGVISGQQGQFMEEAGGYEAKREYDEFASKLEQEQLRLRRETEKLRETNPGGALESGLNFRLQDIERKSLSKQADIAILGNAAGRRYDTALSIAKDKVEMLLAPKKAELEGLKYIQENNKAFQTAEFSNLLSRKNAEIAKEEKTLDTIENIKIEAAKNGLTNFGAFSNVKTIDEALTAASGYLSSPSTDTVKLDNGNTVVIDKRTGKIINNLGGGSATPEDIPSNFSALVNTVSSLENTVAGKKSVSDQMNMYLKNQDYAGAYNQIANTVAQGLPAQIKERFENARVDREILSTFKSALQDFEAGGGDVGLLKGTAENISRRLLGVTGDPTLTALAVQLEREFQAYRNAMTGAAFTPQESKEYAAVNPTANKSLDLNYAVIDGAIAQLNNRVDGTIKAKVPQATDILNLLDIPKTTAEADKEIERIYLNADDQTASIIDKLSMDGQFGSMDILQYLKDKGITK